MERLKGKVAIITGAGSGMGETTARLFAREGAKLVLTDLQEDKLQEVVDSINAEFGDVAVAVKQDVANEEDWITVVEQAKNTFGEISILVNNAGIGGKVEALVDVTLEEWNKINTVNATGTFLGMKHVAPNMVPNSSIINISSLAAIAAMNATSFAYTASKGNSRALSRAAAVEFAKDKIRVNSVFPGYIATPMVEAHFENDPETLKMIQDLIPGGELGRPEDVANTTLFLASDEASFINGSEIVVDGGYTAK